MKFTLKIELNKAIEQDELLLKLHQFYIDSIRDIKKRGMLISDNLEFKKEHENV